MSGIVRAVHQSSSKLGDTPLARLDLFESLPSRRFGCRASTTNSTAKSRSTSLYRRLTSSRAGCRALQLYSALQRSTSLQLYSALEHFLSGINVPKEPHTPKIRGGKGRHNAPPHSDFQYTACGGGALGALGVQSAGNLTSARGTFVRTKSSFSRRVFEKAYVTLSSFERSKPRKNRVVQSLA